MSEVSRSNRCEGINKEYGHRTDRFVTLTINVQGFLVMTHESIFETGSKNHTVDTADFTTNK